MHGWAGWLGGLPRKKWMPSAVPAAQGPLRPAMLGFYSAASDFTRRLVSVRANAKFSSPDAGGWVGWAVGQLFWTAGWSSGWHVGRA